MGDYEYDEGLGYRERRTPDRGVRHAEADYDNEDQGYEQWEEGYQEGDDGSMEDTYLLDPDEGFTEEDLLFMENAFSPHMMGSPVPKDGLEVPDVPDAELDSDGATTDPYEAIEQGKIYYPPVDPPIQPSPRLRDADIATGFGTSADDVSLDEYDLPERFGLRESEIETHILEALRLHGYTADMRIRVHVHNGLAIVRGRVQSLDDVGMVEDIVSEVEGVEEVQEELTIG